MFLQAETLQSTESLCLLDCMKVVVEAISHKNMYICIYYISIHMSQVKPAPHSQISQNPTNLHFLGPTSFPTVLSSPPVAKNPWCNSLYRWPRHQVTQIHVWPLGFHHNVMGANRQQIIFLKADTLTKKNKKRNNKSSSAPKKGNNEPGLLFKSNKHVILKQC